MTQTVKLCPLRRPDTDIDIVSLDVVEIYESYVLSLSSRGIESTIAQPNIAARG